MDVTCSCFDAVSVLLGALFSTPQVRVELSIHMIIVLPVKHLHSHYYTFPTSSFRWLVTPTWTVPQAPFTSCFGAFDPITAPMILEMRLFFQLLFPSTAVKKKGKNKKTTQPSTSSHLSPLGSGHADSSRFNLMDIQNSSGQAERTQDSFCCLWKTCGGASDPVTRWPALHWELPSFVSLRTVDLHISCSAEHRAQLEIQFEAQGHWKWASSALSLSPIRP